MDQGPAGRLWRVDSVVYDGSAVAVYCVEVSPRLAGELVEAWATWGESGLPVAGDHCPGRHELTTRGPRVVAMLTHAKVVLIETTDGRDFVVESSANLRSCSSIEQITVTHDAETSRPARSGPKSIRSSTAAATWTRAR